jgi:hypothetical protein
MIPTVFATAFIYFSGHQRMIAARTIGGWSSFAANRHVRHELPMIGRAVKNMSF